MQRADKRKFHYIYKIVRFDGKYYIGLHSTDKLDDGYFGSGTLLARSLKKHGKEVHVKEILEFLPNRLALKERERELINKEIVDDPLCMNLKLGGSGGFDYINDHGLNRNWVDTEEVHAKISKTLKSRMQTDIVLKTLYITNLQSGKDKATKERNKKFPNGTFYGKTHSNETKKIIGNKNSLLQSGNKNSQYDTRWVYLKETFESKKIKKDEPIPEGWILGRVINRGV